MPFGLKNAPQVFQKWMNSMFRHLPFVTVYIDDILVFSNYAEDHKQHLLTVVQILLQNGVILSPKKSELFKKEIDFLGKRIKNGQIELQHIYTKIRDFPNTFKTLKELQSFLGLLNYGRKFIPNLSAKTKNLQKKS
jgi:putative transposase